MSLESATYVSQLSASNPVGSTDLVSQGDDHIRLIKAALQNTFPGASKAFYFPNTVASQVGDVSVVAADQNKLIPVDASAANRTVTLPDNTTIPDGFQVGVVKSEYSPGTVTIDGNGSDPVNGQLTITLTKPFQHAWLTWCTTLSAWIAKVDTVVAAGVKAAYGGATAPSGWVFCDGVTTIGDASSAATIATTYTQQLFVHLWNSYSNTVCAVSTGRGSTALADYAAHKKITMPDLRGAVIAGATAMGGVAESSRLTDAAHSGTPDVSVVGTFLGGEKIADSITVAQANLPSFNLDISSLVVNPASVTVSGNGNASGSSGATKLVSLNNTATSLSGTLPSGGSGTAITRNLDTVQPTFIDNWIMAF